MMNPEDNPVVFEDGFDGSIVQVLTDLIRVGGMTGQQVFCHATHWVIYKFRTELSFMSKTWENCVEYRKEQLYANEMGRLGNIRFIAISKRPESNQFLWITTDVPLIKHEDGRNVTK